jgi:uncharacterized membrane protein
MVSICDATTEGVTVAIESALYDLKGKRLQESQAQAAVPANKAREVTNLDWRLPEEPGIYLLRGRARQGSTEVARAEMYLKVVPRATRKTLRVLVLGSPRWAHPVADYLVNLGASVTRVVYDPEALEAPEFPTSADNVRRNYDVIWLAGFESYYREAPEQLSQVIAEAAESGVTFVHTGSWGSFHGGGEGSAGLDFTPLAKVLPVAVQHENDVYPRTSFRAGGEVNNPPASWPGKIRVSDSAPQWLRDVDFTELAPVAGYHLLNARPDAQVLLRLDSYPLLVKSSYGQSLSLAYLGFSPLPPTPTRSDTVVRDHEPLIVDRAIGSSSDGRLFTISAASLLALPAQEEPAVRLSDLVESRATPLFETLKNMPPAPWPQASLSWTRSPENRLAARIQIRNGSAFLRGLRLRFEGPDFLEGNVLPLWTNQFFDLLPGQEADCSVEFVTANNKGVLRNVTLTAETLYATETKSYPVPAPPQ